MKKSYWHVITGFVFVLASLLFVEQAQAAAPAAPTNLHVDDGHYNYINIYWNDNSDNEDSFAVYRKKIGDLAFRRIATLSANTRKYQDQDVAPGTTYHYKVLANNGDGNSASSNQASATTSTEPTIRVLSPNGGEVWKAGETHYITWSVDADLLTGVQYTALDETGRSTSEVLITSLLPDIHTYQWTVPELNSTRVKIRVFGHPTDSGRTFNGESDGYFTILPESETGRDALILPAPSNLVVENEGSLIRLNWQDNSSSELGFRIYCRANDGESNVLDTVGPNTSTYSRHLTPGNSYSFRVQAYNDEVASAYSNAASVTISNSAGGVEPGDDSDGSPGTGQTVLRFYIDSTEYYVNMPSDSNSQLKTMDTAPIISGGRTLLPICYVSEPLGADVKWDAALEQVTVKLGSKTIVMWINNGWAQINGVETAIDPINPAVTPIIVPPGRTLLPLSFIALNLGCQVDWNAELREVTVTYPKL